jgi:hypothetical protein
MIINYYAILIITEIYKIKIKIFSTNKKIKIKFQKY